MLEANQIQDVLDRTARGGDDIQGMVVRGVRLTGQEEHSNPGAGQDLDIAQIHGDGMHTAPARDIQAIGERVGGDDVQRTGQPQHAWRSRLHLGRERHDRPPRRG